MMIKKYIGLCRYFHLKNAGRPKRMGHSTCKPIGAVLCGETLNVPSLETIFQAQVFLPPS